MSSANFYKRGSALKIIRTAIFGYGYWGPNVARNLMETDGVEVVACSDPKSDRTELFEKRYPGIKVTADPEELIKDPEIDAVVITTPVSTHYSLARKALERGKHVLVAKPLAASVAEAEELLSLAKERERVLMVDHTFIYTGAVRKMKELVDVGELGDLYYFDSVRVNLGTFQHDSDVIWDLAPHDLSILLHLTKETPEYVLAVGADHTGSHMADMAYITIGFANNFIAHIHVNWLSPVKVRHILLGGSRRMVVYDDMNPSEKVRVYDKGVEVTSLEGIYKTLIDYRTGDMWAPKVDLNEALLVECAHFAECVRYDRVPWSDGNAGLMVVKLLEAASKSLASGSQLISL